MERGTVMSPAQGTLQEVLESPLVQEVAQLAKDTLASAHRQGRGVSSSSSDGIFSYTVWARDTAMAAMASHFFPKEMIDTIATLVSNQHEDGSLPIRVGWVDVFWAYLLGLIGLKKLAYKPSGEPWFAHSKRAVPARDTVYSIIIACFNLFRASREGRKFVTEIFPRLVRALESESKHVDPRDQLVISKSCSDWFDCGKRKGKLAGINLLRCQALHAMARMAYSTGDSCLAERYSSVAEHVFQSCLEAFWDDERGCFTASAKDDRLDTFANVSACLWLPDLDRCVRIQDALEREVREASGLLHCHSRPYSWQEISLTRTAWMTGYGNTFLYPVLADLNISAQARIASCHKNKAARREFAERAAIHLDLQTQTHMRLGTFHEVLDPRSHEPAQHPVFRGQFKSHSGFTPAAAAYLAAYHALCSLDQ